MVPKIEKEFDGKFIKQLEQYVKHKTLEIEVTLKNGQRVVFGEERTLETDALIQHFENGETLRVPLTDISKADIYAL